MLISDSTTLLPNDFLTWLMSITTSSAFGPETAVFVIVASMMMLGPVGKYRGELHRNGIQDNHPQ